MPVTYTSEDANNDFQPRFKITNCLPRLQSHKASWKRFFTHHCSALWLYY